ncbi:GrpB family protein [Enterococcus caccae]|uniref:Glutamate-rich protein GrpB n=1 Tax=Enterococcus caccae ATCC BAA-1240 TaxID=1158612 RepID=R3WME0_9ENTE|nr:GrpB family protein [Enterococcus caccae]EOL48996.1 hypothetical protein UC7_00841 [Enterococcus caccae ATCC BAA-1240]EOT65389.1 hypothetical protein I580_01145 [Enterococcus caccae ATCC BAA-1240]OJG25031.1 hypothetical protein RU98_GL001132 [Enterococcus caccae]
MTRKITVVPPQKSWAKQYEQEKIRLKEIFTRQIIDIHHIGSTAIKNCQSKPVIDILLVVKEIQSVDMHNQEMQKNGYECLGENGISGRRFFSKGGDNRSHHLHVFQEGNPEIHRHLLFRNFMNSHLEEAIAYSQLKVELANKFAYDAESYSVGKDEFIKNIDQKAQKWYDKIR